MIKLKFQQSEEKKMANKFMIQVPQSFQPLQIARRNNQCMKQIVGIKKYINKDNENITKIQRIHTEILSDF